MTGRWQSSRVPRAAKTCSTDTPAYSFLISVSVETSEEDMVSCQIGSARVNVQIKKTNIVADTGVIPSIKQVQCCENNVTRAWDLEKIWVPIAFEPMTSRTLGGRSIHWLSYENLWRAGSFNWVLIWHASPASCRIQWIYMVNNDKWVIVKLQLGKYMWQIM